jgi:hypothetical protein
MGHVDFSTIPDPDVRRALRAMYQELISTVQRQEIEIQAILELMLEKHVGSIGEYKRLLTKLQQPSAGRSSRIHDQIAGAMGGKSVH